MKKILLFLLYTLYFILYTSSVLAVNPDPKKSASPSATPVIEKRQQQIKELREKLATRVAEIRKNMRRAIMGTIKSINGANINLIVKQSEKIVLTDDKTTYFSIGSAGKKEISLKNLSVGQKIVAFGQVDQEDGNMTARVIIAQVIPLNINGEVMSIDTNAGTITVETRKEELWTVDVETYTKILVWEKGKGLTKFGYSKIKPGDRVHVNGSVPSGTTDANRFSANRILVLPGKALGILPSPTPSPTPNP